MVVTEVVLSVIAGVFGLATIIVQSRRKIKELEAVAATQATEIEFRSESLALKVDIADWSAITHSVAALMRETCIDRFFVLNAFNGYHDPRWTTAVYQVSKGDDKLVSYVHFGIDEHYVGLLKQIRKEGSLVLDITQIPDSILRSVYHTEGVLASVWTFLRDKKISSGSVGLSYCTFSTRSCAQIDDLTKERCEVIANQIKGALDRAK